MSTTEVVDYMTPILSTGLVGVFLLMILFRIKIMPTYVHDAAKTEWEHRASDYEDDIAEMKATIREANKVYTEKVIPALTRLMDAERELVDLRRAEQTVKSIIQGQPHGN